jgi:hypothetical protein
MEKDMSFRLDLNELLDVDVRDVQAIINNCQKVLLKDLRIHDLIFSPDMSRAIRHGVYFFFSNENECKYVGMVGSSHFVHRIGGHFGMSPKYGMNQFLRGAVEHLKLGSEYNSYVEAAKATFGYGLVLIDVGEIGSIGDNRVLIRKLERLFHIIYKPSFNKLPKTVKRRKSNSFEDLSLNDALSRV